QADGRAHNANSVNWSWNKARKKAGIPYVPQSVGWHVLRHTAASVWLSNGLSLAMVAAYLGDTNQTVLGTYAHFMPADETRARDVMNGFLVPPEEGSAQNVPLQGTAEL
ncbi:MAG TPA: tyrosine-type recombinase/integrase, partial [Trebonia sp.]|nr:tyrosine-type recombinase/integrase [Trebonia sp.]